MGEQYTNGFEKDEALKKLMQVEFEALIEGAEVLEGDAYGPKIYRLRDGMMLKMFRLKRWFSSALLFPYSRRFERNCRRLRALGVPCPEIVETFQVPHIARDALLYQPLEGETVRRLIQKGLTAETGRTIRIEVADFINRLHEAGILFRSLHLGNVVRCTSGGYGLIDVADLSISRRSLSRWKKDRNFAHLARCAEDAPWLNADGDFVQLCAARVGVCRQHGDE